MPTPRRPRRPGGRSPRSRSTRSGQPRSTMPTSTPWRRRLSRPSTRRPRRTCSTRKRRRHCTTGSPTWRPRSPTRSTRKRRSASSSSSGRSPGPSPSRPSRADWPSRCSSGWWRSWLRPSGTRPLTWRSPTRSTRRPRQPSPGEATTTWRAGTGPSGTWNTRRVRTCGSPMSRSAMTTRPPTGRRDRTVASTSRCRSSRRSTPTPARWSAT